MAVRVEVQRMPIMADYTKEEQESIFGIKRDKVIHNVDTLYYSIQFKSDVFWQKLAEEFKTQRENYVFDSDSPVMFYGLEYRPANFSIYRHCLTEKDAFDIFIAEKVPNPNTPQIVVQIRSILLWGDGELKALWQSFSRVLDIAKAYDLFIVDVYENRIDWAFHTNCIQNTTQYFGDKLLVENLASTLTQYQKVGKVGRELTIDYLSLGKRQSNNIFFRAYNKTREVVEMGYKSIFIDIWRRDGLISDYDAYVLRYAFESKTCDKGYESAISRGRIAWYLNYGRNELIKHQLADLRLKYQIDDNNIVALDDALDKIMPKITQVVNLEFQTKRHFYRSFGDTIGHYGDDHLGRIQWVLKNRKLFLDILTRDTVRFVKDNKKPAKELGRGDYLPFWQRVRACKLPRKADSELVRTYARHVNIERAKTDYASKIATLSVLSGNTGATFVENVADSLCFFNDNDRDDIFNRLFDKETGEVAAIMCNEFDLLMARKKRQYKFLLDRLSEDGKKGTPPTDEPNEKE